MTAPDTIADYALVEASRATLPIPQTGFVRGFAAIGLVRPKHEHNIGSVLRAAGCYDASMVALQGSRAKVRQAADTNKVWRHKPVIRTDDLRQVIPFGAIPVAVDLVDDAIPLPDFQHPTSAFYIFGPEDGTLGKSVLSWCDRRVMVPTRHCMNLAATVNVVLYDRLTKQRSTFPTMPLNHVTAPSPRPEPVRGEQPSPAASNAMDRAIRAHTEGME